MMYKPSFTNYPCKSYEFLKFQIFQHAEDRIQKLINMSLLQIAKYILKDAKSFADLCIFISLVSKSKDNFRPTNPYYVFEIM